MDLVVFFRENKEWLFGAGGAFGAIAVILRILSSRQPKKPIMTQKSGKGSQNYQAGKNIVIGANDDKRQK